jgi:serine/threonine-protein kinase HipA
MRKACISVHGVEAGILKEQDDMTYEFTYFEDYIGEPVSLTMPIIKKNYIFNQFPPFFEGLLPEGILLDALLRKYKLDKNDYFGQLLYVGCDLVGSTNIKELI